MANVRVDSLFDTDAIQKEYDLVISDLANVKASVIDLNKLRIDLKNSTMSDFTAQTTKLKEAIDQTNASTKRAEDSTKNLATAQKQQAAEAKKAANEAQRNAKIQAELANTYKQFSDAARDASIKAKTYSLELGENHPITIEATKNALEMNNRLKELDATTGVYNRNVGNYSSALTGYANTLRGLRGPTKLLGEALGVGAQEADQLRLVIEHSIQGLAAFFRGKENAAEATAASTVATEVNTVAETQNTVTTTGLAAATEVAAVAETELAVATTAASTSMRIFKIAIASTGIGLLLVAIGLIVYKIIEYRKAMEEAAQSTKDFAEVNSDAAKEAGKEIASLKVLKAEIENTLIPMDKRLQAVKNLKDEYPELLKNTTDEALLQGKAAEAYNIVAASILKKARAQAAEAKIQTLVSEQLDIQLKSQEALDKKNKAKTSAKDDSQVSSGGGVAGLGGNFGGVSAAAKKQKLDQDFNVQKEADQREIDLRQKRIDNLLKLAGAEENIEPDKEKKEKADKGISQLKESLDTEFEIRKIHLQDKIDQYQHDIKSDRVYYLDKLTFLDEYIKAENSLLIEEEANAIKVAKAAAEREKKALEESKTGKTDSQKSRINENIAIVEKNLQQQINLIVAQYEDKRNDLVEAAADERIKIIESHLKSEEDLYKEYADREAKIYEDTLSKFKKSIEEREKLDKENKKKLLEADKELDAARRELALKAEDFLFTLATANLENQLNKIQIQKDGIDTTRDAELAANDATVQSEEKKASNIIIINSRAQAEKDALDRKARQIEYKKAQFDKAQQIFEIGIQTIKTIAEIKLKAAAAAATPLIGALLSAKALALIPLALASSALSIGAILANPLPKYKTGRGTGKEELAITGDGGVSEYIVGGDGSIRKTPSVETLTHLMPEDRVLPNKAALLRELAMGLIVPRMGRTQQSFDTEKLATRIEDAVSNIKIHTTEISKSGWREQNRRLDEYNKWVNQTIKN